jgi:hypothetical protein
VISPDPASPVGLGPCQIALFWRRPLAARGLPQDSLPAAHATARPRKSLPCAENAVHRARRRRSVYDSEYSKIPEVALSTPPTRIPAPRPLGRQVQRYLASLRLPSPWRSPFSRAFVERASRAPSAAVKCRPKFCPALPAALRQAAGCDVMGRRLRSPICSSGISVQVGNGPPATSEARSFPMSDGSERTRKRPASVPTSLGSGNCSGFGAPSPGNSP